MRMRLALCAMLLWGGAVQPRAERYLIDPLPAQTDVTCAWPWEDKDEDGLLIKHPTLSNFADAVVRSLYEFVNPSMVAGIDAALAAHLFQEQCERHRQQKRWVSPVLLADHLVTYLDRCYQELKQSSWLGNRALPWAALLGRKEKGYLDLAPGAARAKTYFIEKLLLPQGARVFVMGDLHGSIHSLMSNLADLQAKGILDDEWKLQDQQTHMLFLGDFTGVGHYGVETLYALLRLKLQNWENVHLVRGNHEDPQGALQDGFYKDELLVKYSNIDAKTIHNLYARLTNTLPQALLLGGMQPDGSIAYTLCVHGCFEPYHDLLALQKHAAARFERIDHSYDRCPSQLPVLDNEHDEKDPGLLSPEAWQKKGKSYVPHRIGEGYAWSDVCGFNEVKKDGTLDLLSGIDVKSHMKVWALNGKHYGRGFMLGMGDLQYFMSGNNISAVLRGHQDMLACCKVVVPGRYALVPLNAQCGADGLISAALMQQGMALGAFVPCVFTFATAGEGRAPATEGYGCLTVLGAVDEWLLQVFERNLVGIPAFWTEENKAAVERATSARHGKRGAQNLLRSGLLKN